MPLTPDQFGKSVVKAGLATVDELKALWSALPAAGRPQDGKTFSSLLIDRGQLTIFQADRLLAGLGESLVLGEYVLLDTIGAGGMGQVFQARHRRMDRLVAIKLLSPWMTKDQAAVKRFEREVRAAARLSHPNIVVAYDAGQAKDQHFLAMEYVDGNDLWSQVRRLGPLAVPQALDCIVQVARGLAYAHEQGVVHRDIKPANLLLDQRGVVKILDMGLARLDSAGADQDQLTGVGQIMGTVDYMAPEQALDTRTADCRADIYSLGVTLWYLLTGRAVYEGHSGMAKLLAHRMHPIPSLCQACPQVSSALEAVFVRMVAKQPTARYQTMTEVIRDLELCQTATDSASSASMPSGADARLHDFLRDQQSQGPPPVAIKTATRKKATALAVEPTVKLQSPEVDTDPETQQSVVNPFAVRTAKPRQPGSPRWPRRNTWIAAGGGTLLLLAAIVFFVQTNEGLFQVEKQSDRLLGQAKLPDKTSIAGGWHGWPADAPPPAIAPFDAKQARKHQEEWATHLGVPVEYENTVGMKFVLIPPGEFTMGSTPAEIEEALVVAGTDGYWTQHIRSEGPQHKVILTQPIYFGVHEARQKDYEAVMGKNPSHFAATGPGKDTVVGLDTTTYPVELASWNDAAEFCARLSEKEKRKPFYFRSGETVTMSEGDGYRLPTEAEWEFACRAGTTTRFWSGDRAEQIVQIAWFGTNSGDRAHAVGDLRANPFGLYDIHGNAWEWVQDCWKPNYYGQFLEVPAMDPHGASDSGIWRVVRGGDWNNNASDCRASLRHANGPTYRHCDIGFRVALVVDAVKAAIAERNAAPSGSATGWHGWPAAAPPPAIAPFDADQAKKTQAAWAKYLRLPVEREVELPGGIKLAMVLIPPGEFLMGATEEEQTRFLEEAKARNDPWGLKRIPNERPQHAVRITQPFYLGKYEVTQAQWTAVMGQNPSHFAATGPGKENVIGLDTSQHPVEFLSWNDVQPFLYKLNETSTSHGLKLALPTEAQWEYACRAGTTTFWHCGDNQETLLGYGWISVNAGGKTHPVGQLKPNGFGLYDMHGNVWEWCADWYAEHYYRDSPIDDPSGPPTGSDRVNRGGRWYGRAGYCRSAIRPDIPPTYRANDFGFRLMLPIEAVPSRFPK